MSVIEKGLELHKENLKGLQARITGATKPKVDAIATTTTNEDRSEETRSTTHDTIDTELLLCFDSNGKYIDRKKLWKVNDSVYKTCSTLHDVSRTLNFDKPGGRIRYLLLNVGVNDLDTKDHDQVFGEMELLLGHARTQYPGI